MNELMRASLTIQFMKNLGLMGAMLMIVANGSGPGSLDGRAAMQPEHKS